MLDLLRLRKSPCSVLAGQAFTARTFPTPNPPLCLHRRHKHESRNPRFTGNSSWFSCLFFHPIRVDAGSDFADVYFSLPEPFSLPKSPPLHIPKGFIFCNICRLVLPVSAFHTHSKSNPYLRYSCSDCTRKRLREAYRRRKTANQHEKGVALTGLEAGDSFLI